MLSEDDLNFHVGDVVRLKTGGPKMAVEAPLNVGPPEYQLWLCTWFDDTELKRTQFSQLSLVKVQDDE